MYIFYSNQCSSIILPGNVRLNENYNKEKEYKLFINISCPSKTQFAETLLENKHLQPFDQSILDLHNIFIKNNKYPH